ncbi:hypothetical protein EKO23_24450 [Nocardioides guangzhouensis]|uniref:DUF4399 domain-containing protein n=1 Tax=Nocardioides guangzhouensis TaxID=2497878 RepID=A0A4Q4YZR7_9ACTN|nr:DUF6130 family protein [Nocardioides guangzhouensis]RYP80692.1 hypothetical protein EKO23_24450 [Nocardioides guangzhouensis]
MVTTTWRAAAAAVATVPLLGLLAACGGSSSGSGSPTLDITSPANGAHVGSSFPVTWHSSVTLGAPDTGRDHVHVFVDGHANDYTVVGGDQFTLKGLAPGKHTVDVTLQHADHSSAGAQDQVSVTVGQGGGTSTPSPSASTGSSGSTGGSGGYGY